MSKTLVLGACFAVTLILQVGCESRSGENGPRSRDGSPPSASPDLPGSDLTVALSMPVSNGIAFIDLREHSADFYPIPLSRVDTPSGIAQLGRGLLAVGTGGSQFAVINPNDGTLTSFGHLEKQDNLDKGTVSLGFAGWFALSVNKNVYVTADGTNRGLILELNANLDVQRQATLGFGQTAAQANKSGHLIWSTSEEGPKDADGSMTVVDAATMRSQTYPLPGFPLGMAMGDNDHAYITLNHGSRVVEMDAVGREVNSWPISGSPWGIDINERSIAAISVQTPGGANIRVLDLVTGATNKIPLPDDCGDARDVILVDDVGLVTCAGTASVVSFALDTDETTLIRIDVPLPADFHYQEQPRAPILLQD